MLVITQLVSSGTTIGPPPSTFAYREKPSSWDCKATEVRTGLVNSYASDVYHNAQNMVAPNHWIYSFVE